MPSPLQALAEVANADAMLADDTDPAPSLAEAWLTFDTDTAASAKTKITTPPPADVVADNDPRVGSCWGNFQIVRRIGQGAMGTVYEAEDQLLKRRVAIKLLTGKTEQPNGDHVERIIKEARAIARLEHPNIVGIYQVGQQDNTYFIAMQLVQGHSAATACAQGPLPIQEATRIILEAARGLAAAHAQGLVHRDIKPDNILLGENGSVKIADFGLAKELIRTSAETSVCEGIVGTPNYMSPEQARGLAVDARSDLYALGATWFYLLTGKPVFEGESTRDVLLQHVFSPLRNVRDLRPDVPAKLVPILERTLAKKPEDRYRSAEDLIGALEKPSQAQPMAKGQPRRGKAVPLLMVASVLAYLGGIWLFHDHAADSAPVAEPVLHRNVLEAKHDKQDIHEEKKAPTDKSDLPLAAAIEPKTEKEEPIPFEPAAPKVLPTIEPDKIATEPTPKGKVASDSSSPQPVTWPKRVQQPTLPVIINGRTVSTKTVPAYYGKNKKK